MADTDQPKAELVVETRVDGAIKPLDQVVEAAQKMGRKVGEAADAAARGIDGIGAGAGAGAEKMDKATRSIAASIQRSIAVTKAGERGTADFYDALADVRGINKAALAPYIEQLRQVELAQKASITSLSNMGLTAKQTKAALQQVPAQFTDIITSLQGGQAPLTVLLQQGGQLKDVFGGVGAAARALGGYILGLVNPFTVAGAALGVIGYGYAKGAEEAQDFNRTLIQTGNASGVTAGQLSAMAATLDHIGGGTTAKAAEVLNTMAAAGIRGAENLQRFANAAIELERAGGPAAEKTASAFADLAKEPLKAAIKLNEAQNYLTQSTYGQIKALEDQGRTVEAARVSQEAYAAAIEQRTPEMERQLGTIERAWRSIKSAGAEALDDLLRVGRGDTTQSLLDAQLDIIVRAQSAIDQAKARGAGADNSKVIAAREREIAAARVQVRLLQDVALSEQRAAGARAESAQAIRATVEADAELAKLRDRAAQGAAEELRVRNLLVAAGKDEKTIAAAIAEIRKKYADKGASGARELEAEADLLAKLSGLTTTYNNDIERLNNLRKAGYLTEERYGEEVRKLVATQPYMVKYTRELADGERALNKEREDAAKVRGRYLEDINKSIEGSAKETLSLQDQLIEMALGKEALNERIALRLEDQALAAESAARWTAVTELESEGYRRLAAQLRDAAKARRELAAGQAERDMVNANKKAAEQALREWERASDQVGQALADALMEGGNSGAEYIKKLFRTMVLRPIVQSVVQPVTNTVAGYLGASGGASNGSVYGNAAANVLLSKAIGSTAMGSQFIAGYQGSTLASGLAGPTTAGASGAMGAGSAVGSFASYGPMVAAIAAGVWKANQDYNDGFNIGGARQVGRDTYGIIGTFEATQADLLKSLGVSDRMASLLSGSTAVAKIIGRAAPRVTGAGITGNIGGGDFSGNAYQHIYEKGGLLRSSKSYDVTQELPQEIGRMLDESAKAVLDQAKDYAAALGLPAEKLSSLTKDIKIELGNDAEANKKAILESLAGYGDALVAGWAEALKPLAIYGEKTSETVDRVAGALTGVNAVLKELGLTLFETSVAGGAAAVALANAFGSVEALAQASATYYANFYSEEEKKASFSKRLQEQLAEFGISELPGTREAFRSLVEAQDLTTDSGRKAYAALISVSGAFAELTPLAAELSLATKSAGDSIQKEIDRLRGKSSSDSRESLLAGFATATAQARAGDAAALESLPDISKSLEEAAMATAGSALDIARMRAWLAESLSATLKEVPGFASGGAHSGGWRVVGENGPEIESTGPSHIYSNADSARMFGADTKRLEDQITVLTNAVNGLNDAARATAVHTSKTARLIERAMPDGDAISTRVAVD